MTSPDPRLLMRLENAYKAFSNARAEAERVLSSVSEHPELAGVHKQLVEANYKIRELMIAQTDKTVTVNIGGEDTTITDSIDGVDGSGDQVRKVIAKRLAKRLYALHHPDRGGSVSLFNTVRKAAKDGDLETLMFFRVRSGVDDFSEEEINLLIRKIQVKLQKFKGTQSFLLTCLYFSNRDEFVKRYKSVLTKKVVDITAQIFGIIKEDQPMETLQND